MLDRQPVVPRDEPSAPPTRVPWRVALRCGAVVAAVAAIALWPRVQPGAPLPGYGPAFWVWACSLVAYVLSFRRAAHPYPSLPPAAAIGVVAVLALAAALRFPAVEFIPANISIDEVLPGTEALHIAQGTAPNVFSSVGWFSMPNVTFALPALLMRLLPYDHFFALRLSSALTGIAGILCTFLLARRLLGDRAAVAASFLMAAAFWHIHNSRTGFPFVQSPFCTAVVMYLLVRARQDRSAAVLALAGVSLGLALQCYFPVRILILLCPLFLLVDWLEQRESLRTMLAEAATVGIGTLLVLGPLVTSVPWEALVGHSRAVLITRPETLAALEARYHIQGVAAVWWRHLNEAAAMFTDFAEVCVHNHSPAPLLDVATLVALVGGVLLACLQGETYPLFLVLWAALTFVFGVAFSDWPRASYRLAAAMPALFALAGYGVERLLVAGSSPRRWYRLSVRPAAVAGLAAWVVLQNYQLLFVDYNKGQGADHPDAAARRLLASQCTDRQFYFIGDWQALGGTPQSLEPASLDLFCPAHQALALAQLPSGVNSARPATFVVVPQAIAAVDVLRRCYPAAQVDERRGADGRVFFTTVTVDVADLVTRRAACAAENPATR